MEPFEAFYRVLDPEDNATGGGAASAVSGAMAAALVGMVARLSVGRKNMPERDTYYEEIDRQAQTLAGELLAGSNADAAAFDAIMSAFRLPRETAEAKAARSAAIQAATVRATEVPLANADGCLRVLELAVALKGRSNPNASSDLECAGFLAEAGFRGTMANVEINLDDLKDEAVRARFRQQVFAFNDRLISLRGQA